MAYSTLVRPQMEYASPIWDPYTKGKILQIEKVQRRAARWTINDSDTRSSVTGMLDDLGWGILEQIRAFLQDCVRTCGNPSARVHPAQPSCVP